VKQPRPSGREPQYTVPIEMFDSCHSLYVGNTMTAGINVTSEHDFLIQSSSRACPPPHKSPSVMFDSDRDEMIVLRYYIRALLLQQLAIGETSSECQAK
jgi:hypothetical protein